MKDKLIIHEEARALVNWKKGSKLFDYIAQQEQRDKDVARYFELKVITRKELHELEEFCDLEDKLLEVGKEE